MMRDSVSLDVATENRHRNRKVSAWPQNSDRLSPECWPQVVPKFNLSGAVSVYTIGSCFARNIEEHLVAHGYHVPTLSFQVPPEEWTGRANGILNKFTPTSIYQEIEWTVRMRAARSTEERKQIIEDVLIQLPDGSVIDAELAGLRPVSRERAIERRLQLYEIAKLAFEADVVVITFGLVEAWWDKVRQRYIQQTPGGSLLRSHKDRFSFNHLRYLDCYEYARKIVDLLGTHGPPDQKILITTSPVPLNVTFSGQDVIVANAYAKSLLRTLCGELEMEYSNIAYFPSYESATISARDRVWHTDQTHVKDQFVGKIVNRLIDAFFPQVAKV